MKFRRLREELPCGWQEEGYVKSETPTTRGDAEPHGNSEWGARHSSSGAVGLTSTEMALKVSGWRTSLGRWGRRKREKEERTELSTPIPRSQGGKEDTTKDEKGQPGREGETGRRRNPTGQMISASRRSG